MGKYKKLKNLLIKKLFFNFIKENFDVMIFCHDNHRCEIRESKYYSKLSDSLIEILNIYKIKSLPIALPYSKKLTSQTWANAYSLNNIIRISRIPNRVIRFSSKLNLPFAKKLEQKFLHFCETKIYEKLIEFSHCSVIICIEANIPLCRASRNRKIQIIELLHGIGYSKIPWGLDKRKVSDMPTQIWCLDKKSKKTFLPLKRNLLKVLEIPHPWYQRINKINSNEWSEKIPINWEIKENFIPEGKIPVLVSLTTGYDNDLPHHPELNDILKNGLIPDEVIEAIKKTQKTVFWCLRRHPIQIQDNSYNHQIKFLDRLETKYSNIEWKKSSQLALSSLLKKVRANIQMNTMNCYDCALFGIKTLVLCPTTMNKKINQNNFKDLEELKYVEKKIANTNQIIDFILKTDLKDPLILVDSGIEDFKNIIKSLGLI